MAAHRGSAFSALVLVFFSHLLLCFWLWGIFSCTLPSTGLLHASHLTQWHQNPFPWNWTWLILQLHFIVCETCQTLGQWCAGLPAGMRGQTWKCFVRDRHGGRVPMMASPVFSSNYALSMAAVFWKERTGVPMSWVTEGGVVCVPKAYLTRLYGCA